MLTLPASESSLNFGIGAGSTDNTKPTFLPWLPTYKQYQRQRNLDLENFMNKPKTQTGRFAGTFRSPTMYKKTRNTVIFLKI